ncbi:MAG: IMP dehydrogenase [Thiotrichales bacterium]|nr:IMP dehydrogenase [Thiotrichales bacterium]
MRIAEEAVPVNLADSDTSRTQQTQDVADTAPEHPPQSDRFSEALTFDDVLLVPRYADFMPRDASLSTWLTRGIELHLPVVSAAMDTVTEARLSICIAQEGGIGIVHKNMSVEDQAAEVRKVKKFESGVIKDPITVTPEMTIRDIMQLTERCKISGVPVVDGEALVGIVTNRDLRFETHYNEPVSSVMTPRERLVTVKEGAEREEVLQLLHKYRIEKMLVVDDAFQLRGLITVKDIQKATEFPNACKDELGQLRVGAAVSTGAGTDERVEALVQAGVDVIVVDTAHGHSKGVLDRVRWIKAHFPDMQVIGGNIATGDAARALVEAGADAVKVGIGPGSICTTRIVAGVGVPQLSAILEVSSGIKDTGVPIIADGGIRYSGDAAKALAAGAWSVMVGSMFAGTEESPGEVELYQGRSYKSYRGMGSLGAMAQQHGSSDRYFQEEATELEKLVPEGIEGRVPYKGSLVAVLDQVSGGLRASMGYTGCATLHELRTSTRFSRVTHAGMRESHVHDVSITKEAPNYRSE